MKKIIILIIGICVGGYQARSQKVLNVATQKFKETVDYEEGDILSIDAEKAKISIEGWDKEYYDFEIILKSKHKNQEKAIEELGFLRYSLEKKSDTVRFNNFFGASDKFQKVQGILSLDLIVYAPKSSRLLVKNAYGKTKIIGINGNASITGKFVETEIERFQGNLSATSIFGSIYLMDHSGELFLDLLRTDLVARNISGAVIGKTNYGKVSIKSLASERIIFDSKKTAFELDFTSVLNTIHFELSSQFGKIEVGTPINIVAPGNWNFDGSSTSNVKITTTFSPIIITGKSFNAQKP